ncbi:ABC transporter permease [Fodinicola feengrottensis]|uniref:ABC transporter permease n=1 Tax=Fodinicola feengrottensis TaxID=435914 RepID=A0ABN2FTP1_9ACTN
MSDIVATDRDVIHDIGYRHYEGSRLGRGYIFRSLFLQSLRSAYGLGRSAKAKILPIGIFAVMVLPAFIVVAIVSFAHMTAIPLAYTSYAITFQVIVSIFVASQAPQLVSRDLRFRLTTLYFSRPLSRFDYVTAKFAALASALFVLTAAPLVVLYVGMLLAKLPILEQTTQFLSAIVGAAVLSVLLAGVGLLLASLTIRRGIGVATVIALLLVSSTGALMVQGLAHQLGLGFLATYAGLFSPYGLVDGLQVALLGATPAGPAGPLDLVSGGVFTVAPLVVITASFYLLLARYRKVVAA